MTKAISDLEKYINSDDTLDILIQTALIHYQFETIHPFLDGNGRVGRRLITLFLMEKKVLNSPSLYISYYLKKNRIEYYDRMSEVRNKDNYEQWIKFFLRAIAESSDEAVDAIKKLSALHNKNVELISNMGKVSKNAQIIFDYLEKNPIIDTRKTSDELGISYSTVSRVIAKLEECGILKRPDNALRNRTFAYEDYLKILRKDTI